MPNSLPPPPPPPYAPVPPPPPPRSLLQRVKLPVLVVLACIAGVVAFLMLEASQNEREQRECDRIEARGGDC
jgi:hypothetical protein